MISPGQWHKRIPKDQIDNTRYRVAMHRQAAQDPKLRSDLLRACKEDILFWINLFVLQRNPNALGRGSPEIGPFITWDFQDEAFRVMLQCVEERRDLVIEKSREMGASWMCILLLDWMFLFHDYKEFLVISRDERAVDRRGDISSLFPKLDFVHEHLPTWMSGPRVRRKKLLFQNPLTKSTITGEASTGKAGVGGRATVMFIDEFSQIDEDYEVLYRTSSTAGCRIFNGTHLGTAKAFYELTDPGSAAGAFITKLRLHWTQHPDKVHGLYKGHPDTGRVELLDPAYPHSPVYPFIKDMKVRSPWYDAECLRKGGNARAIACDLDIDPRGSVSQFFDKGTIEQLQRTYCALPTWQGNLDYDKEGGRPLALMPDAGGIIRLWCHLDAYGKPPPGTYTAGADLCDGTGATNSCLSIIDATTGEKVLECTTPFMNATNFAPLCVALCRFFGNAFFAWEMLGPGVMFGRRVVELRYANIYYRADEDKAHNRKVSDTPGWYPNNNTRRYLLEAYRSALATRMVLNRSLEALDECLNFRWTNKGVVEHSGIASAQDPSGARENHGDRVIADALAWMLAKGLVEQRESQEKTQIHVGSLAWRKLLHDNRSRREEAWA